ncbi:RTA1 like protein-domain-containing protein [Exophiala viscosa]|uniref:RTA1 like protein-domain-containing protein n=1 Tax=Exophiala viscosa TaxID=2486360 RepID=A0AAN6IFZ5_9EURO|nr:RTA1 like protein-domain-containing protein [Exophiala viscosa]
MSAGNTTYLPMDQCFNVSSQCPVENTIYGYYPSVGANCFFVAFFFMAAVMQLYGGIRYKTWTYLIAMFLACIDQGLGYIGRVMLHQNPYSQVGFQIQICCLILGPAFNSAAIYLVLKHITLCFGPEYSRIPPRWYTWIFIAGDLLSLVIQAIGGGMAATSENDNARQELGDHLMMAGIALQVVTLLFFGTAALMYILARRRAQNVPLSTEARKFLNSTLFKCFAVGFTLAFTAIFIRCVYRIVEMAGGWGNPIMQSQTPFIVLDGCMVTFATLMQTIFHPGWCFPRLSSAYVPPPDRSSSSARPTQSELSTIETDKNAPDSAEEV